MLLSTLRFLAIYLAFNCFAFQALADDTQELLIRATSKLIDEVELLKRRVDRLEKENAELKRQVASLVACGQAIRKKETEGVHLKKIALATFKDFNRAQRFAQAFSQKYTQRYRAQILKTSCKHLGVCYVVYTKGTEKDISYLRAQGYKDIFFLTEAQLQTGT